MRKNQYLLLVSHKHHLSKNCDLLQILQAYFIQIRFNSFMTEAVII